MTVLQTAAIPSVHAHMEAVVGAVLALLRRAATVGDVPRRVVDAADALLAAIESEGG